MDNFEDVIQSATPQSDYKLVKYNTGSDRDRWADVLNTFFQTTGIVARRDANTMSNIDAVENISNDTPGFLTLLQQISPQPFTWGPVQEHTTVYNDKFTRIICESVPVKDELRADLKHFVGKLVADHEIEQLVVNSGEFIGLIQQNFPELNIQLEGVYSDVKDRVKNSSVVRGAGNLARGAKALFHGRMGLGDEEFERNADAGVEGMRSAGRGLARGAYGLGKGSLKAGKGALKAGKYLSDVTGRATNQAYSNFDPTMKGGMQSVSDIKNVFTSPGGQGGSDDASTTTDTDSDVDANTDVETSARITRWDQVQTDDDLDVYLDVLLARTSDTDKHDTIRNIFKHERGQADDQMTISDIKSRIHRSLAMSNANVTLEMSNKFNQIISQAGKGIIHEAPEDVQPAPETPVDPEEQAMEPPPVEQSEMVPDDIDKMQVDMLELVRQALIINPRDIDSDSYTKLTTRVSFENIQQIKPLLVKLVRNHYPDLEMGDVEPGPGV